MWAVALICIAVVNCNAEPSCAQTTDLPVTAPEEHRIVGGSNTTIEKYPYVVQIRVELAGKIKGFLKCGGTLVTKSHVLTAAHCFFDGRMSYERRPNRCTIREGTTYSGEGGTVHGVTAIKVHEYYDTETKNFDVAVVLMTTPINESVSVARRVMLPDDRVVVPNNAEVIAVGWGRTSADEPTKQGTVLQMVKLRTLKLSFCKDRLWDKLTKNMMCAGFDAGGKGICHGDSGGPLLYKGVIVGISSFMFKRCAIPKLPAVFVNVVQVHRWIRRTCLALSLWDHDDSVKVIMNENNPGGTDPGSTGSLSSKIGFATVLAPILYCILSV